MSKLNRVLTLLALLLMAVPGVAPAQDVPVSELRVYPPEVILETSKSRQKMVVQAVYADGITRDVSTQSQWQFSNPALVRQEGAVLHPAADDTGEVTVSFGGQQAKLPVKVTGATAPREISFR
ncbi:MAG: cell surface protein, partial [Planctomycetaceae bacterium]